MQISCRIDLHARSVPKYGHTGVVKKHFNLVMDNYEKLAAGDPIVNAKNPGRSIRFTDLKNAIKEANAR